MKRKLSAVQKHLIAVSVIVLCSLIPAVAVVQAQTQQFEDMRDKSLNEIEKQYEHIRGKKIRSIKIFVGDVFEGNDLEWFYRATNGLKTNTRDYIVRQELPFKEGDTLTPFLVREAARRLRTLRFLRNIAVTPIADGDVVDIFISVQDTWTFIPQISFSSGDGRDKRSIGLAESNVMGMGKRFEVLYTDDDNRDSLSFVYEDPRIWGSQYSGLAGYFDRNDGERFTGSIGRPFRSFIDETFWNVSNDYQRTLGRLFEDADERFVFRQKKTDFDSVYTFNFGNPEVMLSQFAFGYAFNEAIFSQAGPDDLEDLDLDPEELNQDPSQLADNRRFSGPTFSYRIVEPRFIPMNYIDRFDRVVDYNLGRQFFVSTHISPEAFGSLENTLLFATNFAQGYQFDPSSFMRGEIGFSSRTDSHGLDNSLFRTELNFYDVLGELRLMNVWLGRHTFASGMTFEYGNDFDRDRQLLLGADNGLRGYESKTFSGDKRFLLNIEDRAHFVDDLFRLFSIGAAAFIDVGGSTESSVAKLFTDEIYADVGVGFRLAFPRSSGGRVLRLDFAVPLRDGPDDTNAYEVRIIVSGGQIFDSMLGSERLGGADASVEVGFDQ